MWLRKVIFEALDIIVGKNLDYKHVAFPAELSSFSTNVEMFKEGTYFLCCTQSAGCSLAQAGR
jgi:hypothetical protein